MSDPMTAVASTAARRQTTSSLRRRARHIGLARTGLTGLPVCTAQALTVAGFYRYVLAEGYG